MINTLFDQYQRYNNVRSIINELRVDGETFRILEVGANEHRNLEKFLPLDKITYLDIQLPEELLQDPDYILGDATDMEFPDNHYDVIVALDVFEHIPIEKRNLFIDELYRVSSQVCIITAPFHSQQSVDAESRVNAVFKSLFNKNFIWLEEHMDNGLPNQDVLKDYLNSKNITYKMNGHGNISIWERLMGIHFFAAKVPELASYRQEIDRFYNSYIFDYDFTEESYRKVFVLEKGRNYNKSINSFLEIPTITLKKLEMMEQTFYNLCSMIDKNDKVGLEIEDKIQIFINSGQGFMEEESESFQFNMKERTTRISMDLSNVGRIQSIRIDPSDYSGFFKVEIIDLFGATNEKKVEHQIEGNFELKSSDIYLFEKDDPNIILNIDSEIDISRLEINVSKLSKNEIIDQFINMIISYKQQVDISENLNNDLANKYQLLQELHREIEQLKLVINEKDNEKQGLSKNLFTRELELEDIRKSKSWKLIVKMRKILGR